MGFALLVGCLLVAYSLPCVLFVATTWRRPQLVVLTVVASLLWLASFVVTATLWSLLSSDDMRQATYPLVLLGSVMQELARLLLLKGYIASARSFSVVSLHALLFPLSDLYAAIALGLGFAFAHVLVLYGPVLAYAGEYGALFPGDAASGSCPAFSAFPLAAWSAFFFGALHLCLMVTQLDSLRRGARRKLSTPVSLHLLAALAVVLSTEVRYGCIVSLVLLAAVTAAAAALAALTLQQHDYASRKRN